MRILKFIVDGQTIKQDPACDFTNLVPGTEGYLLAEFSFSSDWRDHVKVASFRSMMGKEYTPQVLSDGKTCVIPAEALKRRTFKIQIIGKKGTVKMVTNHVVVVQNGETEVKA